MSFLSSCGTPGIPLPPSLELPKPVKDLRAIRKGTRVYLTWTLPTQTTDRQIIRHLGVTRICRVMNSSASSENRCVTDVGTVAAGKPSDIHQPNLKSNFSTKAQQLFIDQLPPQVDGDFTYAVEVLNDRGRSAGISNRVLVSAAPTLAPPDNFAAHLTADGVVLAWKASPQKYAEPDRFLYRIYRREENVKADVIAGEVPLSAPQFTDQNIQWEKKYSYRATVVTMNNGGPQAQIEGDDTPAMLIFTHDIFPPAVPSGLQAVFSEDSGHDFIDLIWDPDTEKDLAGYNIFRREAGGLSAIKINAELLHLPAFRDQNLSPGEKYHYSVSAVDVRGNESAHSEEVNEAVPHSDSKK